jgi:hypothetical protein
MPTAEYLMVWYRETRSNVEKKVSKSPNGIIDGIFPLGLKKTRMSIERMRCLLKLFHDLHPYNASRYRTREIQIERNKEKNRLADSPLLCHRD